MKILAFLALLPPIIFSPTIVEAAGKPLAIALSPSSVTVTEGQSAGFTLSKSGGNGRSVSVKVTTSDGSWSAYVVPGTSFAIPTLDDSLVNGTRTIVVTAVASTGATAKATITELDNDVPAPTPTGTDNPLVGQSPGVGAPDIATTDHNVNNDLTPTPLPAADSVMGAFRFICRHTKLAFDDPTVFYQQPGKSHLHDQTGVYGWNASSNYSNLRTGGGGSGCNDVAGADKNQAESSWSANRTPYWQPALLDGKGNVIEVDFIGVYYKRRPSTDPVVSDAANPQYLGHAVGLPNGIKFIFGAFPGNSALAPDTPVTYDCGDGAAGNQYETNVSFSEAITCAKAHTGGSIEIRMDGPSCWDGVNLDSADHRSHLSYPKYGDWGYQKCDAAHPYVIPTYTYAAYYTILPSDDGDIHWSSDEMDNSKPRGWSFHVDYGPAAWDPTVLAMWTNNCIEKLLSCSGGNLGNGLGLKGAGQPIYLDPVTGVWTASMRNPVRLVPVPAP